MGSNIIFAQDIPKKPDAGKWVFNKKTFCWEEKRISGPTNEIFICGYVRSGNNFLIDAASISYKIPRQECCHTTLAIDKYEKILTPFRDPKFSIASWSDITNQNIDDCINFYIRFNKYVLENIHKVTLLDFNEFTKDIDYFYNKINKSFELKHKKVSVEKIYEYNKKRRGPIMDSSRYNNTIKEVLKNKYYKECFEIYNKLKKIELEQNERD